MKIALLLFFYSAFVFSAPPIGVSGQSDSSNLYPSVIKVPNKQSTSLGGGKVLLETGNENILTNPSFEHSNPSAGWSASAGSLSAEGTIKIHGGYSLKATLAAQTLELYQDSTLYQDQFADGVQGIASVRIKTALSDISVCPRLAGVTQSSPCATVNSDNKWMLYKVPFVFGGTSNGIAIVSSGNITGDVYVDDAYLGTDAGIADVSVITPWQSFTPTIGGFGTVSAMSAKYRQVGGNYEIHIDVTAGTVQAATATISLPNNHTIKGITAATNRNLYGYATRADSSSSSNKSYTVIGLNGASVLNMAGWEYNIGQNPLVAQNGNALVATGERFEVYASVPINELSGSTQVFASQCGAACENDISWKVSSAGVVSQENVDIVNGNCVQSGTSNSISTCTYNSGILTTGMNCTATATNSGRILTVGTSSSSQIITATLTDGGTATTSDFYVTCQKQGADYQSSRTIVGSFKEVMTVPGISKPKTCYASFGGAGSLTSPTVCSSGTCIEYFDSCGTFSPPARTGEGYYLDGAWAASTFANSTNVQCSCVGYTGVAGVRYECNPGSETGDTTISTSATGSVVTNPFTSSAAGTAANTFVQIKCEGQAP